MTNFSSNLTAAEQEARSWRRLLVAVSLTALVALAVGARTNPKGMLFLVLFMGPAIAWVWWLCHRRVHLAVARREEEQKLWPRVQVIAQAMEKEAPHLGGLIVIQRLPEYAEWIASEEEQWQKAAKLYVKSSRDKSLRYAQFEGEHGQWLDTIWRARMVGGQEVRPAVTFDQYTQQTSILA